MNGKENIINKILADADEKCAKIIASANETAAKLKQDADNAVQADKQALSKRMEIMTEERIRNRIATAELDARKYRLSSKQKLIADCYAKASSKLAGMSADGKQAFVVKLLKQYAEEGETVYVSKADKDVITQKTLDQVGKKLTLAKSCHSGQGGVVLEGKGYEKDLTLCRIVNYLREKTEAQVAKALFGD